MRVLYVDDEAGLLEVGKRFLERGGEFSVDTVLSASEALEFLIKEPYDAVISDYQMPEMDGIAFLKQVRSQFGNLPFILFTGRGREEVVIQALNDGADFYLQKGGQPTAQFAELSHKIIQAVTRRKAEKDLQASRDNLEQKNLILTLLHDLGQEFVGLPHEQRVEDLAEKKLQELSNAVVATFLRYDPVERMLRPTVFHYAPGIRERLPGSIKTVNRLLGNNLENIQIPVSEKMLHEINRSVIGMKKTITDLTYGQIRPVVSASLHTLSGIDRFIHVAHILEGELYGVSVIGLRSDQADPPQELLESFAHIVAVSLRRQRAEDALRESEGFSRSLVENLPDYIVIYGNDGKILYVNPPVSSILGYSTEELIGKPVLAYVAKDYRKTVQQKLASRRDGRDMPAYEIAIVKKDGLQRSVIVQGTPLLFRNTPATLLVLTDITDKSMAGEALRESEERLRSFIEQAHDGVSIVDEGGRIIEWNAAQEKITGIPRNEAVGVCAWDLATRMIPDQHHREAIRSRMEKSIHETIRTGKSTHPDPVYYRFQRPDGTVAVSRQTVFIVQSSHGNMIGTLNQDVTEQQRAEEKIKESEESYRGLFNTLRQAIYILDEEGKFIDVNKGAELMYGYAREEFLGKTPEFVSAPGKNDLPAVGEYLQKAFAGEPQVFEFWGRRKNNEIFPKEVRLYKGTYFGRDVTIATGTDITERRNSETAFRTMVMSMVGTTGMQSLWNIAKNISSWLGADCVMIGKLRPDGQTVNVLSMVLDGKEVRDFTYTLKGTPCENTAEKGFCLYPDNTQDLFPGDRDLGELNIRGYAGTPLRDAEGKTIGVLCILTRDPLTLPHEARKILDIIAVKASAEIERKQSEERLTRINEALLNVGFDPQKNIQSLTRLCGELLNADCVLYNRLDEGLLCVIGQWNCPTDLPARDSPDGHICYDVIRNDHDGPLVVCDLQNSRYAQSDPNVSTYGLKTYIGHPVRFEGVSRGSLCAVYTRNFTPTVEDQKIIGILSSAVAQEEERREADRALRESEKLLRDIIEKNPMSIQIVDKDGFTLQVNPAFMRLFGSVPPLDFSIITDLVKSRPELESLISQIKSGEPVNLPDMSFNPHDIYPALPDVPTRVRAFIFPLNDRYGKPERFVFMHENITEQKQAEDALQESRQVLEAIIDNVPARVFWKDKNLTYLGCNTAFARDAGFGKPEEIIGKNDYSMGWRDQAGLYRADDRHVIESGNAKLLIEEPQTTPSGEQISLLTSKVPLRDAAGEIIGVLGTYLDVTGRKKAEEALLLEKNFSDRLFDAPHDTVFLFDPSTGKPIRWNKRFSEESGYTDDEIAGMKAPRDFYDKADLNKSAVAIAKIYTGNVTVELSLVAKQGAHIPFEYSATPIETTDGKTLILSIGRNITERKLAEEALLQANRKLNLLSSITRHDINNQLTVQMGYLSLLEKKQPDATHNEYFQKVSTAAKRISAMVEFTKEYENIGVNAPEWQDCRRLVDTAAKQAPLGKVIVKNDLPANAEVFADPLVVKVFYNLMDNAARYGGKITTIRFSATEVGDDQVIVCEDDGDGVVAEEKEKIFERGFGKNTGLGLALSREILSITGITIKECGEPGKGARFEIAVPKGAWK